jgi:hypothetical protein
MTYVTPQKDINASEYDLETTIEVCKLALVALACAGALLVGTTAYSAMHDENERRLDVIYEGVSG